jgi:hypothetical protein
VLLVFLINTGLLHTLFWLFFVARALRARGTRRAREGVARTPFSARSLTRCALAQAVAAMTCLRALAFVALLNTDARTLRAALAVERQGGGSSAASDDLEAALASVAAAGAAGGPPGGPPGGGAVDPLVLQLQLLTRELTERDYAALLALDDNGGGGHAVRGLTRAQVDALPTHAAPGGDGDGAPGGVTCAVCLEDAAAGETLRTLPCAHQARAAQRGASSSLLVHAC